VWIVQLGLKRPYTFVVMAMLVLIFGIVTLQHIIEGAKLHVLRPPLPPERQE
jgi:hypothetical protein